MALVACRECKALISRTAKVCPQCGAKAKKHSIIGGVIGGIFLFGLLFVLFGKPEPKPAATALTAEEQAAADKERADRDANFEFARGLREHMKNPDSFKVVKAVRGNGGFCVQYRATNAMGATVTEAVMVPRGGKPTAASSCDGMDGKDVTSAVEVDLKHMR